LIGIVLVALCIAWCTYSAALMFVRVLMMVEQRLLVGYPLVLFYTCFALISIFKTGA
jgi:hypothetical protein